MATRAKRQQPPSLGPGVKGASTRRQQEVKYSMGKNHFPLKTEEQRQAPAGLRCTSFSWAQLQHNSSTVLAGTSWAALQHPQSDQRGPIAPEHPPQQGVQGSAPGPQQLIPCTPLLAWGEAARALRVPAATGIAPVPCSCACSVISLCQPLRGGHRTGPETP